jgi:hypothetical protein
MYFFSIFVNKLPTDEKRHTNPKIQLRYYLRLQGLFKYM